MKPLFAALPLRLRIAWRYRVLPWHLPRGWRFIALKGPSAADVARVEQLAQEMGWGTLLGDEIPPANSQAQADE